MPLTAPQMAGDQLNPADIENHTLIVIPLEFIEHVPTIHTKPGEQSPCIRVNVADLSAVGGTPVIYRGVLWFNALLHGGLRRQIGETTLGRMIKGQATPGKNAPWQLQDVMPEPEWVQFAEGWLNSAEGRVFEAESLGQAKATAAAAPAAAAPASAPPAPAGPPPAPAGPPVTSAPPAPAAAPPPPAAVAAPAPAGDPMAMLAAMPEEERAKFMAALSQQGKAAH